MVRSAIVAALIVFGTGSAYAQGSFDGVYRSPAGGIAGNARCGTTNFGYPLRVTGGMASLHTNSYGDYEGPVGPDGSVSIQHGTGALTGKIAGNRFDGTLTMGRGGCGYSLQYTK